MKSAAPHQAIHFSLKCQSYLTNPSSLLPYTSIQHIPLTNPSFILICTGLQHSHPPIPSFLLKSISIPHKTMRIIIMKLKA